MRRLILLIFIFLFTGKIWPQQYFFKNYSAENGLPFVQVSCLYQDREGYLWIGGFGGLARFDGETFTNYTPKNGLIDHNVTAIAQDDYGSIFTGTNKGLSIVVKNKIINYPKSSFFNNANITSFSKWQNHVMYIGTNKGLFSFSENKIEIVKKLAGLKINCLFKADTSSLYIGSDSGVVIYTQNNVTVINSSNGLASNHINCITRLGNSMVFGTDNGLSFYNLSTKKITSYFIENGLIDEAISTLLSQDDNTLWIGSQTGLLRFDGTQFSYYNIGYDNNSNVVRCLLEDREGNVWTGTHSGVFKYRDNSFSTFDKINGPGNAFIFQIFRDKDANLWLCSDNNGIYKYYQGYFKRYGSSDGLGTNICHAGIQDKDGRLIFGTRKGLVQFTNEKFTPINLPADFSGPYETIIQTHDGRLWITGTNAVASLTWKNSKPDFKVYHLPVTAEAPVYGLTEDDDHNLWIGTYHAGLFKLVGDSIHNMNKELNLDEENHFALRYISGKLFSANLNGVMVLDIANGKYTYINQQDGLNSELVYSLGFADNNNTLWIGTNQGINKLNLKNYLQTGRVEITSYGKLQGFMGVECNSNGIWEDSDRTLWFGTISGLVKHEPYSLKRNLRPNNVIIQSIRINNEDTTLSNNVELPSDLNTINFYYKGICLTNPQKVQYVKMLEGLEKDWSKPSDEDYSKYANLAPGKYTFKVKSCNDEGIWDEHETTFSFTILAPFYTQWWFILLVIAGVSAIIFITIALRIRKIKRKQKEEFERKVEMSKIELKALRSQMNPHFIFNSLNSIQHYIFNSKSEEAIRYLNKFARLVRIILNNSNKPTVTIGEDLEALNLYLQLEQMRFEEKFEYEVIIDPSVDMDYDIMPPLLTQPYVENAILHGLNPKPEKGKLTISLTSKNNFLICTITDNGIGREKAAAIKHTMPANKHKSLGMKITEDRLRILNEVNNSHLSVNITDLKSPAGEAMGTKVELFIPLNG